MEKNLRPNIDKYSRWVFESPYVILLNVEAVQNDTT